MPENRIYLNLRYKKYELMSVMRQGNNLYLVYVIYIEKNKKDCYKAILFIGGGNRARTCDLLRVKQAL